MQIALQDIRTLGYKKISRIYMSGESKEKFFDDLQILNTMYYTMRIPAYSLLNKWGLLNDSDILSDENIRGYCLFIYNLEPLINLESPSDSAKRKCRNMWGTIWDNFGSITGLEGYQTTLLKDFGLKILFIYANYLMGSSDLDKLCVSTKIDDESLFNLLLRLLDFYNVILTWSVFCQQESNFTKNNLSFIDVLSILTLDSSTEFRDRLKDIY